MAGKIITIDWQIIKSLPDDVYQLKLLNKQQSAILLALCEYQHWKSRWDNLELSQQELDRYIGEIEFRLMEDAMAIDYEALKQAIADGIYKAGNDFAKQLVSGRTNNIAVDGDGAVTDPTGQAPEDEIPPDDPETEVNEELSSRAGGCKAATDGLQEVLTAMFTWYAGGVVTSQQAETRLVNLYNFEPALATHFANYWYTVYMNTSGAVTLNEATLDSMFFCKGLNMAVFAEYVYEIHATSAEIPVLEVFIADFPEAQLGVWFERGSQVPTTEYIGYSCTRIQTEIFTFDMSTSNAPTYVTNGVWKAGHRYLIEITGSYQDSDLPDLIGDGMYFYVPSTGAKTFSNMNFNFDGTISVPTQALVPYSTAHSYAFTIEKNVGSGSATRTISRDNGSMTIPNVTGILTIKITDMGEFAL